MSGSSGTFLAPSNPATSCSVLKFDTQLASPKQEVVRKLSVEDKLDISIKEMEGNQVVIALYNGLEAGGIIDPRLNELRNCMSDGEQYKATVLSINGGQVGVRVSHV